eukprot:TRINITY_DN26540_c0_g1_i2.p1 TRINITY_DN26540_c0_g1~~TRINITY_DN26540_c0_g1_i2.p1  ORF type:complete len:1051 (-),score=97.91 TRINITY_DN26540_c0_g1_i2:331-3483(-)
MSNVLGATQNLVGNIAHQLESWQLQTTQQQLDDGYGYHNYPAGHNQYHNYPTGHSQHPTTPAHVAGTASPYQTLGGRADAAGKDTHKSKNLLHEKSVHPECTARYGFTWVETSATIHHRLQIELKTPLVHEASSQNLAFKRDSSIDKIGEKPKQLVTVEQDCERTGRPFVDPDYQLKSSQGLVTRWCRPHELTFHDNRVLNRDVTPSSPSRLVHQPTPLSQSRYGRSSSRSCGCLPWPQSNKAKHWQGQKMKVMRTSSWKSVETPSQGETTNIVPRATGSARGEDWQLFRGPVSASDVQQGELGNSWLTSALAVIAHFDAGRFVRKLFPGQQHLSSQGVYLVRLCSGGSWQDCIIDDRLPCTERAQALSTGKAVGKGVSPNSSQQHRQLAYCCTLRCQLWASLIEKAVSKVHASYSAIKFTNSSEPLTMLTGCPCLVVQLGVPGFDPGELWNLLFDSKLSKYIMTCSAASNNHSLASSGLVKDQIYNIIDIRDYTDHGKLLKIRAPYNWAAWQRDWSAGSRVWTPALREKLGYMEAEASAGVFFIKYEDFLTWFSECTICKVNSIDGHTVRLATSIPSGQPPVSGWEFQVSEPTKCVISISQPELALRSAPLYSKLHLGPLANISFVVVRISQPGDKMVAISDAKLQNQAVVCADCWLQPNEEYVLLPVALHPGGAVPAYCCCLSRKEVRVTERLLEHREVQAAWAALARKLDPRPVEASEIPGARLFVASCESGVALAMAENSGADPVLVELNFQQQGQLFSRGMPRSRDTLQPGESQLLQVVMPLPAQTTGNNGTPFRVNFETCSPDPMDSVHFPELGLDRTGFLHAPFDGVVAQDKITARIYGLGSIFASCKADGCLIKEREAEEVVEAERMSQMEWSARDGFVPNAQVSLPVLPMPGFSPLGSLQGRREGHFSQHDGHGFVPAVSSFTGQRVANAEPLDANYAMASPHSAATPGKERSEHPGDNYAMASPNGAATPARGRSHSPAFSAEVFLESKSDFRPRSLEGRDRLPPQGSNHSSPAPKRRGPGARIAPSAPVQRQTLSAGNG